MNEVCSKLFHLLLMKQLFPPPRVGSLSITNLRQTQKGFWAVTQDFVCFRQLCWSENWKTQFGLHPDETGRVQWYEGVSASQTAGLLLLANLIWFWENFNLSAMLIAHRNMPIFGCMTFGAQMILLCWERTKSFFNYANKFMTSFSLWFSLQESALSVLLIPTLSPHLRPKTSNPITHCLCQNSLDLNFLFILTVGELHCWLNSSLSWMDLFAEHSRKGAGLSDASCLSQGENCFCSHNSHNIPLFLAFSYVPQRGTCEEGANESNDSLSASCFSYVCIFWRNEKSFRVSNIQ